MLSPEEILEEKAQTRQTSTVHFYWKRAANETWNYLF